MSKNKSDALSEIQQIVDSTSADNGVDEVVRVEMSVRTFDQEFANDPLAADYKAFGSMAKETFDSADACVAVITMGDMGQNLMFKEKAAKPTAYDRADVIEKLRMAMTLCGSPITMTPQEIMSVFWVYRLDRSIPGDESKGEPRSFKPGVESTWFGGNISTTALRILDNVINKRSQKTEVDVWDYEPAWEAWSRSMIAWLRRGDLSVRQLEALAKFKKSEIAKANKEAARAGKTPAQVAEIEQRELQREQQRKIDQAKGIANKLEDYLREELKKDKAGITQFLVNQEIIPPVSAISAKDFAGRMTPGDAKLLVQSLQELGAAAGNPVDRQRFALILKALQKASTQAVKEAQSANNAAKIA
jgi:hypothetical protein